jgi:hypothetical protein
LPGRKHRSPVAIMTIAQPATTSTNMLLRSGQTRAVQALGPPA